MSLWDDFKNWFSSQGISPQPLPYDPYAGDIPYAEPWTGYKPPTIAGIPSVPEADYEYYTPEYSVTGAAKGSLWDSLIGATKEIGKVFAEAYVGQFKTGAKGSLQDQIPHVPEAPYDRMDAQVYTPYPRKDTGTPSPITVTAPGAGISPMVLLLIAGGAALFLMKRR